MYTNVTVKMWNTATAAASCCRLTPFGTIFDDLDLSAQWHQHTRAVLAELFGIRVLGEYLSDGLPGEGQS